MIVDMLGYLITVGCKVVTAVATHGFASLRISTVTEVVDNGMVLDNTGCLHTDPKWYVVIGQDPLFKMIKEYEAEKDTRDS